jgi:hypothetical protein
VELQDVRESPETKSDSVDKAELEQKIQEANGEKGTFRSYDMNRNGEIRTTSGNNEGLYREAQATFHGRDGKVETVGTARYSVELDEAKIYPDRFQAADHKTESALLSEVGEKAQAQGASKLSVWVKDGSGDAQQWSKHGFQPTERAPGAAGTFWQKQL